MDGLVERRMHAYYLRVSSRETWAKIAEQCGYTTGRGAQTAARLYAESSNSPWPVVGVSKGACLYFGRMHGLTWLKLARLYGDEVSKVQQCAYKWASRHDRVWPPGGK